MNYQFGQSKSFDMQSLPIDALVGRIVKSAKINNENDVVILDTDKGPLFLSWVGDCCAHCYLQHVSGADNLIGAEILTAENAEWDRKEKADCEVTESMGTNIKTTKGYVTFESRVDHNGYYGGNIEISEIEPINAYSSPRFNSEQEMGPLKHLTDF